MCRTLDRGFRGGGGGGGGPRGGFDHRVALIEWETAWTSTVRYKGRQPKKAGPFSHLELLVIKLSPEPSQL